MSNTDNHNRQFCIAPFRKLRHVDLVRTDMTKVILMQRRHDIEKDDPGHSCWLCPVRAVFHVSTVKKVATTGSSEMAQLQLGAIRQSLYRLIELGDEQEARKSLELLDQRELRELIVHLTTVLSLANSILDDRHTGAK
jgi:hypothetical protein